MQTHWFQLIIPVFLGGGLGSLARFGVSIFMLNKFKSELPVATLLANLLACLVMGGMLSFLADKMDSHWFWRPFILIGFCGGFSTFSTFSLETVMLIKNGDLLFALANVLLSVLGCVIILLALFNAK